MSKNKSSEKPIYEILYLISNKYSEDELPQIIKKVEDIIKKEGGEMLHKEDWGKRKLAYRIKLFSHGYYNLTIFKAGGNNLKNMDRLIKIMSEILRHQIVRISKKSMEKQIREYNKKIKPSAEEPEKNLKEEDSKKTSPKKDEKDEDKKNKEEGISEKPKKINIKTKEEETLKESAEKSSEEKQEIKEEKKEEPRKEEKTKEVDLDEKLDKILEGTDLI